MYRHSSTPVSNYSISPLRPVWLSLILLNCVSSSRKKEFWFVGCQVSPVNTTSIPLACNARYYSIVRSRKISYHTPISRTDNRTLSSNFSIFIWRCCGPDPSGVPRSYLSLTSYSTTLCAIGVLSCTAAQGIRKEELLKRTYSCAFSSTQASYQELQFTICIHRLKPCSPTLT
jgi:hypothetical protein